MATSKTKQATAKKPPKRKLQRVKEAKAPAKKKKMPNLYLDLLSLESILSWTM
jgi:hypothetical protein